MIGRAVFSSWGLHVKLENVSSLQQSNSLAKTGLRRGLAAEAALAEPCWRELSAAAGLRPRWSCHPAVKRAVLEMCPGLSEAGCPECDLVFWLSGVGTLRF